MKTIESGSSGKKSRRRFLGQAAAFSLIACGGETRPGIAREEASAGETYETQARGLRILPGKWRPHYPWEHIAWISPSWPSQDYLWLDFPEAIFTNKGLLYLSHINPPIHTVFENLPPVEWNEIEGGIGYERELPNGFMFAGKVTRGAVNRADLELRFLNGTEEELGNISLQTCAFLRGIREFGDYTRSNKFVHLPEKGWVDYDTAVASETVEQPYRVGWRKSGKPVADWPLMATRSSAAERYVLMTWYGDTLSMVSNPNHPCMQQC
jgi:hypothetical protein